ncbi:MAG TPA: hypothetical protein DCQ58_07560, partial [Saprospirales bacterium]|nr:hypothetical protein [Saprospirales bacterium]
MLTINFMPNFVLLLYHDRFVVDMQKGIKNSWYFTLLTIGCMFNLTLVSAQTTTVYYTISNADFANPERGFCRYTDTYASDYSLFDSTTLANFRTL